MKDDSAPRQIRAEGIEIRVRSSVLLEGFTWTHTAGSIAWLTGDNGAGKSSLLAVLAGRRSPSRGRVLHVAGGRRERRTLYYQPGMRLPSDATVGDWRRLATSLSRGSRGATEIMGLTPNGVAAGRPIRELSTGEAKRLLLAALLARPAEFLLLDEPYEHLSAPAKVQLTDLLTSRAHREVVIVATNQRIGPLDESACVVHLDRP